MRIYIWGTEAKANCFVDGVSELEICGVIDSDKSKQGKLFRNFIISGFDQVNLAFDDVIVICSSAFDEIIKKINERSKNRYVVMAPEFYQSLSEFEETEIYSFLSDKYISEFKSKIKEKLISRYGKELINYIAEMKFDKDNYPLSAYETGYSAIEVTIQELICTFLKKYDCTLVQKNIFGYSNYMDYSFGFINLLRYSFPIDAYPWLCYVDLLIRKGIIKKGCAFDVGSNCGIVSSFLAERFSVVHSFEPSEECNRKARENISLNGYKNIVINQCGVSDRCGEHIYYEYGGNGGNNSFYEQNENFKKSYIVKTISLDNYCNDNNIETIDFLKLDVEGFEPYVINGSQKLLEEKRIRAICLEVSPGLNKDRNDCYKMLVHLFDAGFTFYDVKEKKLSLDDILDIRIHQDIIGINNELAG